MDGRIVYVVDVLAADAGSAAGCGAPGRQVQFRIADTAMATAGSWRDDGVTLLDLSVDVGVRPTGERITIGELADRAGLSLERTQLLCRCAGLGADDLERRQWFTSDADWLQSIEVAIEHGVDHIVRLTNNKGLAAGFQAGLDACLKLGADVIVNTDADNQYFGGDIPKLVAPIVEGRADMVVGDRQVENIPHFSRLKVRLQHLGSWVVRQASGTNVPDTTSGFRAYNREAAIQMAVVSKFTYTLETIIQAGKLLVAIDAVPIATNEKTRESRLFPSMWAYVRRNSVSIFRIYAQYEPMRVFTTLAEMAFASRCGLSVDLPDGRGGLLARLFAEMAPSIPARACDDFRTVEGIVGWVQGSC